MPEPVSIRTKNPGAMWPGAIATEFGSTSHEDLRDGNKAAIFPTFQQGAAAQFALWAKNYSGMTLEAAIKKWSGGNSSPAYAAFLKQHTGLMLDTPITRDFLASERGLAFMKAQAQWEAGKPYPMTDDQWRAGQRLAFGAPPPDSEPVPVPKPMPVPVKPAAGAATAGAGAAVAAHQSGLNLTTVLVVAAVVIIAAFVVIHLLTRKD